ncbi:MAG: MATE family efflux transporter [Acutalibacteraceae bacterium]
MRNSFCNKQFRSLLLTGSVTIIIQYLLILSDTVIIGNILGEQDLAAVNVIKPFHSFAIFIASLISIGTSVFYSYEIGRFNKDKANALFGQGIIMSVLSGVILLASGFFGKGLYFDYLSLSPQVAAAASDYFFYYQFVILLLPVYTVLLELVYADGDELICNISSVVQMAVNIISSVLLCFKMGIIGVGLGSLLGIVFSIAVLVVHFFRKQNSLKFVWFLGGKDILKVLKCGITDASAYLFMGMTSFAASKFVIYRFGEYYLPVLLVVFNIIELTTVFDGIGQAVTPVVNVYRGEQNYIGIRRVMKTALKYAIAEGVILSVLLYVFGGNIAELFGLVDTELIRISKIALRLVSPFFFCSGVLFLQTTYYMIIEKVVLATVITGIKDWLIPSVFICVFGFILNLDGVWIGLGLSPFASLVAVLLFIYLRYGKEKFPLLLPKNKTEVYIFDAELSQKNIIELRDKVAKLLSEKEISQKSIRRIMLFIEEFLMLTFEKNCGKKVTCECSVMIGDDVRIILRDNGVLNDATDSDSRVESFRSYVVSNLMLNMPSKRHLTTTGCNRNMFTFEK